MSSAPVRLGRYRLSRRIAVGGMAEVFLAHFSGPEQFEKDVVIKRIHAHMAANQGFVSMFLAEARLMAALDHPNLVQVYELDRLDERYCIIMEYLEGESLRTIVMRALQTSQPIPPPIAAFVVSQACQGADYAHDFRDEGGARLGVVHRDLSPMNVVVTRRGDVKVVDFGIAKYTGTAETRTGIIKGTVRYMSPEQILGTPLDRRSDVFSLGAVLYEVLTGRRLYEDSVPNSSGGMELLHFIGTLEDVPPDIHRADVPEPLRHVLRRALQPDAARRYDSAAQMARDLERYLRSVGRPLASDVGRWLNVLFEDEATELAPLQVGSSVIVVNGELADPAHTVDSEEISALVPDLGAAEPTLVLGEGDAAFEQRTPRVPLRPDATDTTPSAAASFRQEPPHAPLSRDTAVVPSRADTALARPRAAGKAKSTAEPEPTQPVARADGTMILPEDHAPTRVVHLAPQSPFRRKALIGSVALVLGGLVAWMFLPGPQAPAGGPQMQASSPVVPVPVGPSVAPVPERGIPFDPLADVLPPSAQPREPVGTMEAGVETDDGGRVDADEEPLDDPTGAGARKQSRRRSARRSATRSPKKTRPASPPGRLIIESEPVTTVYVGGKSLGKTPIDEKDFPPGRHTITLVDNEKHIRKRLTVTVSPKQITRESVEIGTGTVIFVVDGWADVFLGNQKLDTTPMPPRTLFEGTYEFTLVNPETGKRETARTVVKAGQTTRVKVDMR